MTEETTTFADSIKTLGDSIVGLTLLEAQQLSDYLKDAYGIEPAAGGMMMARHHQTVESRFSISSTGRV
jgi:large subunit ribosomal protein L7/L12